MENNEVTEDSRTLDAITAELAELIAFDTVSSRPNLPLIDHVAGRLQTLGVDVDVIPGAEPGKASLWATFGPQQDGGIVLAGHSDVVPVTGQSWASDPFALSVRGARAFGRGACDMKGFIACVMASAPRLATMQLRRPIHLALTYDEEVGCVGAPHLLAWLAQRPTRPAIAFIGEPTSMQVVNAHKGIMVARTTIKGAEAHSSLKHLGVSAVELAGQAIVLLRRIGQELAENRSNAAFMPPHTTISVNQVIGGTAVNILAGEATLVWDARTIAGDSGSDIVSRFMERAEREIMAPWRAQFSGLSLHTDIIANAPALGAEEGGVAEALAKSLVGSNSASAVPYAAEAGQFQQAGLSAVIIGPGSIEQAHKADEYVDLDQLGDCYRFLSRLSDYCR